MKRFLIISLIIIYLQPIVARQNYVPTKENQGVRRWFQEAKFGFFIHWGVYSVLGDGENYGKLKVKKR